MIEKKTFLGFDITPRKALWQEVWALTRDVRVLRLEEKKTCQHDLRQGLKEMAEAIAKEQAATLNPRSTDASLAEALKRCAELEEQLAQYERQRDSKGRFCKKTQQPVAPAFNPPTVRLCGLEWMTEPLTGFGGTEVLGRTYYTQDEAIAATAQIGNGWRLPTKEEHVALAKLGSSWVDKGPNGRPGRWFGGNHATDHDGSVFFEASGYRGSYSGGLHYVGTCGYSWSSSPAGATSVVGSHLYFDSSNVYPECSNCRANGRPVRCVREVK